MTDAIEAGARAALAALTEEDERQSKLNDLLETIREQIRLDISPEHRPDGLFKNIQDAVYTMRGRTILMNDASITAAIASGALVPASADRHAQCRHQNRGWEVKMTFDTRPRFGHNFAMLSKQSWTKITYMSNAKGYVMARRPGCSPFVITEKQWLGFDLYTGQAERRAALTEETGGVE